MQNKIIPIEKMRAVMKIAEEVGATDLAVINTEIKMYLGGDKTLNIVFSDDFSDAAVIGSFNPDKVKLAEEILTKNGIPLRD